MTADVECRILELLADEPLGSRYGDVVKLRGCPGDVCTIPGRDTTTSEVVMRSNDTAPRMSDGTIGIQRSCERCGRAFFTRRASIKRGQGRFCTIACSKIKTTERDCLACGASFRPTPAQIRMDWGKYCSHRCSSDARRSDPLRMLNENVDRSAGPERCWPWTGRRNPKGYGIFTAARQYYWAHRLAWETAAGREVPEGLLVRHLCPNGGNPWCCNPAHLDIGTDHDNMQDMVRSGRSMAGERNHAARLTWERVGEIRRRFAEGGATRRELADEYGVDVSTVELVIRRKTWR